MWQADPLRDPFESHAPSEAKRAVTGELTPDDLEVDRTLRPQLLSQYV